MPANFKLPVNCFNVRCSVIATAKFLLLFQLVRVEIYFADCNLETLSDPKYSKYN